MRARTALAAAWIAAAVAGCDSGARDAAVTRPVVVGGAPAAASQTASKEPPAVAVSSRYSSLEGCTLLESSPDEAQYSAERCEGAGYALKRTESDGRQDLALIAADGREQPLNLTGFTGGGFSSLGQRAEWRGPAGAPPTALIVRYSVVEQPEEPERPTSYLMVAKVGERACVIGKLAPGPDQNDAARSLADAGGPCLASPG